MRGLCPGPREPRFRPRPPPAPRTPRRLQELSPALGARGGRDPSIPGPASLNAADSWVPPPPHQLALAQDPTGRRRRPRRDPRPLLTATTRPGVPTPRPRDSLPPTGSAPTMALSVRAHTPSLATGNTAPEETHGPADRPTDVELPGSSSRDRETRTRAPAPTRSGTDVPQAPPPFPRQQGPPPGRRALLAPRGQEGRGLGHRGVWPAAAELDENLET